MKKAALMELLDSLPDAEAEIERMIADGVQYTQAAAEAAGATLKAQVGLTPQQQELVRTRLRQRMFSTMKTAAQLGISFKAAAGDPAELAASLLPVLAQMSDDQYDDFLDALDEARGQIEGAADDEPAESDEAGMLPSAGGAVATKGSGNPVVAWVDGSPARVATKAASRQPETLRDLYWWSQGRW